MPFSPISTTNPTSLGFGTMSNVRTPTNFWGSIQIPRKTNDTWTNLVVDQGDNPVGTFPYIYKADNDGLNVGYNPIKTDSFQNSTQDYNKDYGFYSVESLNKREVIRQDVFGCEYKWYNTSNSNNFISTCFVKGQGLTTIKYNNLTPVIRCDGGFTKINTTTSLTNNQTFSGTTLRLETNNGKVYKLYIPSSQTLTLNTNDQKLIMNNTYSGIIKFVYLGLQSESIATLNAREVIYDTYGSNSTYVTGGNIDNTSFSGDNANFVINWTKQGGDAILQFAFPHTQDIIQSPNYKAVTLNTMKGDMRAIEADSWTMIEPLATYDFYYNPFNSADIPQIISALANDYTFQPNSDTDTYFGFKELMKSSQLATIAEQLGETSKREAILDTLVTKINAWLNATNGNKMKYDTSWGGFTGEQGLADSGASFGSGTYSDHHFHYGYFINACAVLAKLRPSWATSSVIDKVNLWIRDIFNPSTSDTYFPQYRCKDWFCGHAWANGTSGQGGVNNQESTSEDINAWYGVYLWGKATNNNQTRDLGRLALAQSIRAARKYWTMPSSSNIYPSTFKQHKVVGILEGTRASYGTFFGGNEEFIHGIQMLPFSNPTKQYYSNLWNGSEHWDYINANILNRSYPVKRKDNSIVGGSGYGGTLINYYGTPKLLQDNCPTVNITGSGTGLRCKVFADPGTGIVTDIETIGQYSAAGTGYAQNDIVRPITSSGSGCTFQVDLAVEEGWKSMFYMYRALTDPNDAWSKVNSLTGYDGGNSKTNTLAWVSQFRSNAGGGSLPAPTLNNPSTNANNISLTPTFSWNSVSGATNYQLQLTLATDTSFNNPVLDVNTVSTSFTTSNSLQSNQNYIWRVKTIGVNNPFSGNNTFSTIANSSQVLARYYIYQYT